MLFHLIGIVLGLQMLMVSDTAAECFARNNNSTGKNCFVEIDCTIPILLNQSKEKVNLQVVKEMQDKIKTANVSDKCPEIDLEKSFVTLDLSRNGLNHIEGPELMQLKIHAQNLSYNIIKNGVFDTKISYTDLIVLDLSHNEIQLIGDLFDKVKPLRKSVAIKKLLLHHNQITYLDLAMFDWPSLKLLDISYNKINTLQFLLVSDFPELTTLKATFNNLRYFNETSSLTNLKYLNLANNRINSVALDTIQNLNNLRSLDLSNNNIRYLILPIVRNSTILRYLNLSNNHLFRLEANQNQFIAPQATLDFSNNQLGRFQNIQQIASLKIKSLILRNNVLNMNDTLGLIKSITDIRYLDFSWNLIPCQMFFNTKQNAMLKEYMKKNTTVEIQCTDDLISEKALLGYGHLNVETSDVSYPIPEVEENLEDIIEQEISSTKYASLLKVKYEISEVNASTPVNKHNLLAVQVTNYTGVVFASIVTTLGIVMVLGFVGWWCYPNLRRRHLRDIQCVPTTYENLNSES